MTPEHLRSALQAATIAEPFLTEVYRALGTSVTVPMFRQREITDRFFFEQHALDAASMAKFSLTRLLSVDDMSLKESRTAADMDDDEGEDEEDVEMPYEDHLDQ